MYQKKISSLLFSLLGFFLFSSAFLRQATAAEAPTPRSPLVPRITSAEQLVPFAKIILQRDYIGQRHGWSIRGGERVLLDTNSATHPLLREAFAQALKELGAEVDVMVRGRPRNRDDAVLGREVAPLIRERLKLDLNTKPEGVSIRKPRGGLALDREEAQYYDVIIGSGSRMPGLFGIDDWATPEALASVGTVYPGEIMDMLDGKVWAVLRNAERVEITGLQGSKGSFTWFPEWWEVIEGTHDTIRNPGYQSTFGTNRPGRSEFAYFAGHVAGVPAGYSAIEQSDFEGIIAGTIGQWNQIPKLTIHHEKGEAVRVEGGGDYGDMWRETVELTKDIQYPGYPRPGTGWFVEFALGTNPKMLGPMDVEELRGIPSRDSSKKIDWVMGRDRSGVFHAGYGTLAADWWAQMMTMPVNHHHIHALFFISYIVHTRDGRRVTVVDKGHLTALDDPEVRALAATYGDPDALLSEDWIPILQENGYLGPPKAKMVSYEEFIAAMPFQLDDPRLIYRRSEQLEPLYGQSRVRYYKPEQYMEFYRKLGQIPVRRVNAE